MKIHDPETQLRIRCSELEKRCDDTQTEYLAIVAQRDVEILRLSAAIKSAPCSQNSIPCGWPCNNDSEYRCWKQIALLDKT